MELNIVALGSSVSDRFRSYVVEKAAKVGHLAERAISLGVKVIRETDRNGHARPDRVELTLIGRGPVIRAEAEAADKYSAFDVALGRLLERVRRAKDRRKVHRGGHHHHTSLREVADNGFSGMGVAAAGVEVLHRVATGGIPVIEAEEPAETEEEYSPVVIRHKVFQAEAMSVDDALYQMELVGHDFFLFVDAATERPSVVYRRKGWDYGVIGIDRVRESVLTA
ncbi:MAG TPA: ribosome-associated translation inhibitor RaiA [Candidatus Lumbricidophila sp.]|nr:ribosome-associated translation inhibitor RaiA [Candidatus Lumbricidophila sp.]